MFHPAAAATAAGGVLQLNQTLVESQEIMAATSHIGFNPRASPPPPPPLLCFGVQHSLDDTCSSGGGAAAASRLRGSLQPLSPKHGGVSQGQFCASSSAQISSSNIWPWAEEGALNKKEVLVAGESNKNKKKNSSVISNDNIVNGLSIGDARMKKVKARKKVREPRFCFKTMSDVDVLDDGYKWRKYGQKVVKNTQHPRSYYRCTQDNCRVKKRIERLAEDPRMVITTYEGRHVHSPSHNDDESQASSKINLLFW